MYMTPQDQNHQLFLSQFFDSLQKASETNPIAASLSAMNRNSFVKRDLKPMREHLQELLAQLGADEESKATLRLAVSAGIQSRRLGAQRPELAQAAIELGIPQWAVPAAINIG
jgi:predicted component of type VI protein secretion system